MSVSIFKRHARSTLIGAVISGAVMSLVAQGALAASPAPIPTWDEVQACYEKAQSQDSKTDPDRLAPCLEKELALVKSEHKDTTERVAAMAKAADKAQGVRTRWTKFIQAGQSFDTFVTRECAYFGMVTKGNRRAEKNGELACRINYYRMRTNVLKNRFLSAAK